MRNVLVSIILLVLTSSAFAQDCPAPLKPMLRVELYFGRTVQGRPPVSERQWAEFVALDLTPRFPGLTVLDAKGAWREGKREVREKTKLVIVALTDTAPDRAQIAAAMDAYRKRFH